MNTSSSIDPADNPVRGAETRTLWPGMVVRRRLPVNFQPKDSGLFNHELERRISRTDLLEMKDVRLSPEGILFKQGKIFTVSYAFPWMLEEWRTPTLVKFLVQNYLVRKHIVFEKDAAWIVDNWSHGYFHWLADTLSRLFTIRDRMSDLVLLLPHRYKEIEFVRTSLKPFNLGGIEFMGKDEVPLCRRLLVPTHTAPSGQHNEEIIKGVRDLLVDCYGDNGSEADGRVYISRWRATKRKIINEEEIVNVLCEFGFRILCAEELPFAEQVRICSAARYLVSNHGSGLTNMLFMSSGGKVLELRHQTDNVNNCYFNLASALDLNYFYQTCQPEKPGEAAHSANILVDSQTLRENLKRFFDT